MTTKRKIYYFHYIFIYFIIYIFILYIIYYITYYIFYIVLYYIIYIFFLLVATNISTEGQYLHKRKNSLFLNINDKFCEQMPLLKALKNLIFWQSASPSFWTYKYMWLGSAKSHFFYGQKS